VVVIWAIQTSARCGSAPLISAFSTDVGAGRLARPGFGRFGYLEQFGPDVSSRHHALFVCCMFPLPDRLGRTASPCGTVRPSAARVASCSAKVWLVKREDRHLLMRDHRPLAHLVRWLGATAESRGERFGFCPEPLLWAQPA
jgi:hypothetical protein